MFFNGPFSFMNSRVAAVQSILKCSWKLYTHFITNWSVSTYRTFLRWICGVLKCLMTARHSLKAINVILKVLQKFGIMVKHQKLTPLCRTSRKQLMGLPAAASTQVACEDLCKSRSQRTILKAATSLLCAANVELSFRISFHRPSPSLCVLLQFDFSSGLI